MKKYIATAIAALVIGNLCVAEPVITLAGFEKFGTSEKTEVNVVRIKTLKDTAIPTKVLTIYMSTDLGGNWQRVAAGHPLCKLVSEDNASVTFLMETTGNPSAFFKLAPFLPTPLLFTKNMSVGSTGEEVANLQTLLQELGYLFIPVDSTKGYFGSVTRSTLANFQLDRGISPADGVFGPLTRAVVNSMSR